MILNKQVIFILLGLILFHLAFSPDVAAFSEDSKAQFFLEEEKSWRAERDQKMRSPTSWLSIAGLFWLQEGENSFGTDETCDIVLPQNSAREHTGLFTLTKGNVFLKAHSGVLLKVNGKIVSKAKLKGDDTGKPDIVEIGDLKMWVINRGDRYAIRLRDLNHPPLKEYKGLAYFSPERKHKIKADFLAYSEMKTIAVPTMIGTQAEMTLVGTVRFRLDGQEFQLQAFGDSLDTKTLFFIFKDGTNGHETYDPGRFLVAAFLENGKVDLNFNRAYNPPCAYTLYATCPLPSPENHLSIRIEAGEKKYSELEHE